MTLDDDVELLIKKREINLMKIDVEGHEAEVIRGAKRCVATLETHSGCDGAF